jgi:hypothetical protein
MQQLNYMTPFEVRASVILGNRIAAKIAKGKPIRANAALRHAIAMQGPVNAARLATELLGVTPEAARALVERLQRTPANDIVSPYHPG